MHTHTHTTAFFSGVKHISAVDTCICFWVQVLDRLASAQDISLKQSLLLVFARLMNFDVAGVVGFLAGQTVNTPGMRTRTSTSTCTCTRTSTGTCTCTSTSTSVCVCVCVGESDYYYTAGMYTHSYMPRDAHGHAHTHESMNFYSRDCQRMRNRTRTWFTRLWREKMH